MRRISLPPLAVLAACTPPAPEAAMHPRDTAPAAPTSTAIAPTRSPSPPTTTPEDAAARGRRILSTAFVRVGPDGYLTVETGDGRMLTLRDVAMRRDDYCGTDAAGARHCGGYDEVAAARPGGGPVAVPSPLPGTDAAAPGRAAPRRP